MSNKYAEMDEWSDDEVAFFKEETIFEKEESFDSELIFDGPAGATIQSKRSGLTVVAEGDSWFDYKISADLIDCLRKYHGYRIKNYARIGDTLENMIYGSQINSKHERVTPQIRIVLERVQKSQPEVFLFSGGGNDIAGNDFISYLHHAESGFGVLKEHFVLETVNVIFRKYYQDLISKVLMASPNTHIFVHGYGYVIPSGEGVGILGIDFIGPWLRPSLAKKGINPETDGKQAVDRLIDLYNEMLVGLDNENPNFHHVDLRNIISDDDWRDELHLKSSAYRLASDEIDHAIRQVFN